MINKRLFAMCKDKMLYSRPHVIPFLIIVLVMLGLHLISIAVHPGIVTWVVSSLALIIVTVTALVRLNDITPELVSLSWQVRRVGLILTGASAIGLILGGPTWLLLAGTDGLEFPTWREVALKWGFALTWLTTPHMPPWWKYITGEYKTVKQAKEASAAVHIEDLCDKSPEQHKAVDAVQQLKDVVGALSEEVQHSDIHKDPRDE